MRADGFLQAVAVAAGHSGPSSRMNRLATVVNVPNRLCRPAMADCMAMAVGIWRLEVSIRRPGLFSNGAALALVSPTKNSLRLSSIASCNCRPVKCSGGRTRNQALHAHGDNNHVCAETRALVLAHYPNVRNLVRYFRLFDDVENRIAHARSVEYTIHGWAQIKRPDVEYDSTRRDVPGASDIRSA